MKISNKKIIVSTLALAMGAALAGSISGSVAWYQYSTRAAAQITGTSAGTIGNLKIKSGTADWNTFVSKSGDKFQPISASGSTAGSLTYYRQPVARTAQLTPYGSTETVPYKEYVLDFKFEESENGGAAVKKAKDVYLTKFEILNAGTGADVSDAVRVEILGETNKFFLSKAASDPDLTTATKGHLDLDPEGTAGHGKSDTEFWKLDDSDLAADESNAINYINGTSESYSTQAHDAALVTISDPYDLDTDNSAKSLGVTKASGDDLSITVRVWLEGWALLGSTPSANWGTELINQNFNINMQFACSATKL